MKHVGSEHGGIAPLAYPKMRSLNSCARRRPMKGRLSVEKDGPIIDSRNTLNYFPYPFGKPDS